MKLFKNNKKGIIDNLSSFTVGVGSFAIILVVVFLILSTMAANTTVAADPNATEAIDSTQEALDDIPTWLPIIVIVLVGALLIGLVALFKRR